MLGNGFFIFRKMGKKISDGLVLEMYKQYQSGLNTKEVGAIYGVTAGAIQSLFKRLKLSARHSKRYGIDHNYFSSIDSPKKAYIVGFLAADGGLDRKALSVKVSIKDVSILEMMKMELKSDVPIKFRKGQPISDGKYTQSDFCYIRFCSVKIFDDLVSIGITPKKSLTLKPPKNIPDEFIKYFILGYFDGDGTIGHQNPKNPRFSMLGTLEMTTFIQNHLVVNAGLTVNSLSKKYDSGVWQVGWGGPVNAIKFRDYMYDTKEQFSLARKRERFFTVNTIKRVHKKGKPVLQFDLNGGLIKKWDDGVSGLTKNGFKCARNLYTAITKQGATAYGFKWMYA